MSDQAATQNECFKYELAGKSRFADPMRVRRILLEVTNGRMWTILKSLQSLQESLRTINTQIKTLQEDLDKNPSTPEEIELQTNLLKELKDSNTTIDYEKLTRRMKVDHLSNIAQQQLHQAHSWDSLLCEASFKAFNLPVFDPETGVGCTEEAAIKVLMGFVNYAEKKGERLGN